MAVKPPLTDRAVAAQGASGQEVTANGADCRGAGAAFGRTPLFLEEGARVRGAVRSLRLFASAPSLFTTEPGEGGAHA